jgi:hypothetical protein
MISAQRQYEQIMDVQMAAKDSRANNSISFIALLA